MTKDAYTLFDVININILIIVPIYVFFQRIEQPNKLLQAVKNGAYRADYSAFHQNLFIHNTIIHKSKPELGPKYE